MAEPARCTTEVPAVTGPSGRTGKGSGPFAPVPNSARPHVGSSARFALRYNEHVPAGHEPDELYAILGLAPDASVDDIRRAYHQLAMRWHPDRAGPDATFIFQRLSAAYQVLTDPVARAAYDRERGVGSGPGEPVPPARRAPGVLIHRLSSPIGVLLARGIAERADDGAIVLHLEPEEAAEGGMVTIAMPVAIRCPSCTTGPCTLCGATRAVEELFAAWLAIRPGIVDGTMLSPSAQLPGVLRPVVFRARLAKP